MEVKIAEAIQEFTPVTINITFDTPAEIRAWLALTNQQQVLEEIIAKEAQRSPGYFGGADQRIAHKLISWGTVWHPLNKLVNPDRA